MFSAVRSGELDARTEPAALNGAPAWSHSVGWFASHVTCNPLHEAAEAPQVAQAAQTDTLLHRFSTIELDT
jgi:hypothetical protein